MRLESSPRRLYASHHATLPARSIAHGSTPPRADSIRRPHRTVFGEATSVHLATVAHAHALAAFVRPEGEDRQSALARSIREREARELRWQREAFLIRAWR